MGQGSGCGIAKAGIDGRLRARAIDAGAVAAALDVADVVIAKDVLSLQYAAAKRNGLVVAPPLWLELDVGGLRDQSRTPKETLETHCSDVCLLFRNAEDKTYRLNNLARNPGEGFMFVQRFSKISPSTYRRSDLIISVFFGSH